MVRGPSDCENDALVVADRHLAPIAVKSMAGGIRGQRHGVVLQHVLRGPPFAPKRVTPAPHSDPVILSRYGIRHLDNGVMSDSRASVT